MLHATPENNYSSCSYCHSVAIVLEKLLGDKTCRMKFLIDSRFRHLQISGILNYLQAASSPPLSHESSLKCPYLCAKTAVIPLDCSQCPSWVKLINKWVHSHIRDGQPVAYCCELLCPACPYLLYSFHELTQQSIAWGLAVATVCQSSSKIHEMLKYLLSIRFYFVFLPEKIC